MKVSELIEMLQKHDPNAEVFYDDGTTDVFRAQEVMTKEQYAKLGYGSDLSDIRDIDIILW